MRVCSHQYRVFGRFATKWSCVIILLAAARRFKYSDKARLHTVGSYPTRTLQKCCRRAAYPCLVSEMQTPTCHILAGGSHLPGCTWGQRTGRLVQGRSQCKQRDMKEEANDRCRTPNDSSAEDEHSDHNQTTLATRHAPTWAPFTFQGLSCELRHAIHGRYVKARPARPRSTRLRSRREHCKPFSGSIIAQTKRHAGPRGRAARHEPKDWRQPWRKRRNARLPERLGSRRMDDGDRDAGVHST